MSLTGKFKWKIDRGVSLNLTTKVGNWGACKLKYKERGRMKIRGKD